MKKIQYKQRQSVANYFNKTAGNYFSWYKSDDSWLGYGFRIRKDRVLELFDRPGGKVLDVGCGPGIMAMELVKRDCDFWGMDLSLEMLKQGNKIFGPNRKVHFFNGTAENLCFSNNAFDAVISMGVIEFVNNDELAIKEMIRVLQPGGILIVAFISKYSPFRLWRDFVFYPPTYFIRRIYYKFAKRPRKPHIKQRTYTEKSICKMLDQNHCRVTDIVYCNFNIFLPPLEHFFPRLCVSVSERLEHLCRGNLRWLGGGFIVKAKRL